MLKVLKQKKIAIWQIGLLTLALNIHPFFFLRRPPPHLLAPPDFFSMFYLREQWDMCLCCIFLWLFWLSLYNILFICFLSCPIVINYIVWEKALSTRTIWNISSNYSPLWLLKCFYIDPLTINESSIYT